MEGTYRISTEHNVKLKEFKRLRVLNIIFSIVIAACAIYMMISGTETNQDGSANYSEASSYKAQISVLEKRLSEKSQELAQAEADALMYSEKADSYYKEYLNYYVLYTDLLNAQTESDNSVKFTLGSSMDDVMASMGSPSKIEDSLGYGNNRYITIWYYGTGSNASTVTFNTNSKKVIAWEENGTELNLS